VLSHSRARSFRLTFNGYTTAPIAYDANAAQITAALEQLAILSTPGAVKVTFGGSPAPSQACFSRLTYPSGYFMVEFMSTTPSKVTNLGGNLPLLTGITNRFVTTPASSMFCGKFVLTRFSSPSLFCTA
jgi:hypothetical protein